MKRILITGANSYIGTSFETYLSGNADYKIDTIDMKDELWQEKDFSSYDLVFHVAGIAHDTSKKKDKPLYYKINRDLAIETAKKAKNESVKQFIFMSSMLVYNGVKERNITKETLPKVKGYYGDSKIQADLAIQKLSTEDFKVAILRPPMIFGKACKGNFPKLIKLAQKVPIFPNIKNQRSMLYIDNLCEIVKLIIDNESSGTFFPQNPDYFCTSIIVKNIAVAKEKKIRLTKLFNWLVWLAYLFLNPLKKLFGNLTYDKSMSNHFDNKYQIKNNDMSVEESL